MLITPKVRGFICTTAHPEGCQKHTQDWIDYVKAHESQAKGKGPKKVLVIGASTGYGLASRISAAFGYDAATIGVFFEKPSNGKRTASAGWYNSAAFEQAAKDAGLYAKSFNADAFSADTKQQVIDTIKKDWDGEVDLVVYSLAAPVRPDSATGELRRSSLKPIGNPYTNNTVDTMTGEVTAITIEPATEEDIDNTVFVMGGDDWQQWIDALLNADVLAENAMTVAYSYIGPQLTYPVYREGTIGKAKEHLEATAKQLNQTLQARLNGRALVSVNKALVTQASSAIPVVPLYISILYKIMKQKDIHEGCQEQMWRLFTDFLYRDDQNIPLDDKGRVRIDDWEMRDDVQQDVDVLWAKVNSDNIYEESDLVGYRQDFYQLFGFDVDGVDYDKEQNPTVDIESID